MGLGAFKALGGVHAVACLIEEAGATRCRARTEDSSRSPSALSPAT